MDEDVIRLAQKKRARLMAEIEARMDQVAKLDNFIIFGARLSTEKTCEPAPSKQFAQ